MNPGYHAIESYTVHWNLTGAIKIDLGKRNTDYCEVIYNLNIEKRVRDVWAKSWIRWDCYVDC